MTSIWLFEGFTSWFSSFHIGYPYLGKILPAKPISLEELDNTLFAGEICPERMNATAEKLRKLTRTSQPDLFAEIKSLQAKNQGSLCKMKEDGWANLKKSEPKSMLSFDSLRQSITTLTGKVSINMATDGLGSDTAFGTVGPDSDIDRVLTGPLSHTQESREWGLFQHLWRAVFDGHTNDMADVSTYTNHPGEALQTEARLTSPEAKSDFAALEANLAALQVYRSLSSKPNLLSKYRTRLQVDYNLVLKNVQGKNEYEKKEIVKRGKREIERLGEAQAFERALHLGILKVFARIVPSEAADIELFYRKGAPEIALKYQQLLNDPNTREKMQDAILLFRAPLVLQIGKKMDALEEEILTARKEDIDPLYVKLAAHGSLRNALYDDSYLTQGGYGITCFRNGGQIHEQRMKQALSPLREAHYDEPKGWRGWLIRFLFGGQPIRPLSVHGSSKDGTPQECLSSMRENLGKFLSHYQDDLDQKATPYDALVKRSKYLLRIVHAGRELVAQMKSKDSEPHNEQIAKLNKEYKHQIAKLCGQDEQIAKLNEKHKQLIAELTKKHEQSINELYGQHELLITELYEKVADLEKLKRKKMLPFAFAIRQLANELRPSDPESLIPKLTEKFAKLKDAHAHIRDDLVAPEDLFALAVSKLEESELPESPSLPPKIEAILRSLAGLSLQDPLVRNYIGAEKLAPLEEAHTELFKDLESELMLGNQDIEHLISDTQSITREIEDLAYTTNACIAPSDAKEFTLHALLESYKL